MRLLQVLKTEQQEIVNLEIAFFSLVAKIDPNGDKTKVKTKRPQNKTAHPWPLAKTDPTSAVGRYSLVKMVWSQKDWREWDTSICGKASASSTSGQLALDPMITFFNQGCNGLNARAVGTENLNDDAMNSVRDLIQVGPEGAAIVTGPSQVLVRAGAHSKAPDNVDRNSGITTAFAYQVQSLCKSAAWPYSELKLRPSAPLGDPTGLQWLFKGPWYVLCDRQL